MRIITGTAKGARLEALEGEVTRPTAERTKEAIFSMLQFDIEGKSVLEPFGGSGQLSLEALSRGASSAFICDKEQAACEVIKRNAKKTRLFEKTRIVCSDSNSLLKNLAGKEKFGLIFLDPPYASELIEKSLRLIKDGELVSPFGYIVCESDRSDPFTLDGFSLLRHAKYGKAFVTVLRKDNSDQERVIK